jgi:uncharacterized lipoprotein YajG
MKAACFLLGSATMLAGCSQAISYTYSKSNFTSPSFRADLAECKGRPSPLTSYQEVRQELRDAQEQDCMASKGYRIDVEPK